MRERFSKRLRRTMKLRGLTQQEVADKANIVKAVVKIADETRL